MRAQREAERKRQERELLHLQEEQERLQRKKVMSRQHAQHQRADTRVCSECLLCFHRGSRRS